MALIPVGESKELTHIIVTISVRDYMVIGPKDINSRLDSNEPKEFVKEDQDNSSIRMQLACTQHVIPKHYPDKPFERKGIP
jgi:hypothetical protein